MYEFPLSFLTQNLYQDFFGFLDRYDCIELLTVNKAIAEDIPKYVSSTAFPTPLFSEKNGRERIIANGYVMYTKWQYGPVTSITYNLTELPGNTTYTDLYTKKEYVVGSKYIHSIHVNHIYHVSNFVPYDIITVKNKQEADNIIYDFAAFKKHQVFCKKRT